MDFENSVGRIAFAISCVLLWGINKAREDRRSKFLPPGPRRSRWPFIGNALDMPHMEQGIKPWIVFDGWAKEYGDIMSVVVFGRPMIILSSPEAVTDLFEKRSTLYSGRMRQVMMVELMDMGWQITQLPYGEAWRIRRKVFHQHFGPEAMKIYRGSQMSEAHKLLKNLNRHHSAASKFLSDIRLYVGAAIMKIMYGLEVTDPKHPFLVLGEHQVEMFSRAAMPGTFLCETIPALKYVPSWVPGASFKLQAASWSRSDKQLRDEPFQIVKGLLANGSAPTSVAASMLEDVQNEDDEIVARDSVGVAYAAGIDTTSSFLQIFVLAMITHQSVQEKAQAELDRVIGVDTLPTFRHRDQLPYIDSLIKECMRWGVILPMGIPHQAMSDEVYKGYHIPKGALVMANSWSILHNSEIYPDPEVFRPERFLEDGCKDYSDFAFGYGRRVCPGRWFATEAVWVAIVSILASFDIVPSMDKQGKPKPVTIDCTTGAVSMPVPFDFDLRVRSASMKELLAEL